METTNKQWKLLTKAYNEDLNEALQHQLHAALFIAMAGHHLIPHAEDDRNTRRDDMC